MATHKWLIKFLTNIGYALGHFYQKKFLANIGYSLGHFYKNIFLANIKKLSLQIQFFLS